MTTQGNNSIEDYLRNVKARLGGLPNDERSAIMDNLEAHVHDSLRARCQGADPTPEDVRAVLAEMDPPEAFGPEQPEPRRMAPWPTVGWVVLAILLGYLCLCFYASLGLLFAMRAQSHGGIGIVALPALFLFLIVPLIVAAFSREHSVRRAAIVLAILSLVGILVLMVVPRLVVVTS